MNVTCLYVLTFLLLCFVRAKSEHSLYDKLIEKAFLFKNGEYHQLRLDILRNHLNPYTDQDLQNVLSNWKGILIGAADTILQQNKEQNTFRSNMLTHSSDLGEVNDGYGVSVACMANVLQTIEGLTGGEIWTARSKYEERKQNIIITDTHRYSQILF